MKRYQMYTNTGNASAVIGLIAVTFVLTAVTIYTPAICEGIMSLAKKGKGKVTDLVHKGKQEYAVCAMTQNGTMYDTGQRIWK